MTLQAPCTAAVVFFSAEIADGLFAGAIAVGMLQTTAVAVLAHLGLVTILIYLEEYVFSLVTASIFLLLNLDGAFATLAADAPAWGLSYLVAKTVAAAFGAAVLFSRLRVFDRVIFSRSASYPDVRR